MSEETPAEPVFWTLRRKLIFLALTLVPLLFSFYMSFSKTAFWRMGRLAQMGNDAFSCLGLIAWTWEDFVRGCHWLPVAIVFTFPAIMYVLWWFRPSFLKSYAIVLLVLFISWRLFESTRVGGPSSYLSTLRECPALIDQIPGCLKFLIF